MLSVPGRQCVISVQWNPRYSCPYLFWSLCMIIPIGEGKSAAHTMCSPHWTLNLSEHGLEQNGSGMNVPGFDYRLYIRNFSVSTGSGTGPPTLVRTTEWLFDTRSSEIRLSKLKLRLLDICFANHRAPCILIWKQPIQLALVIRINTSSECSAQGQVLHCKLRHQGCSSVQRQVFHCKLSNQGSSFTG